MRIHFENNQQYQLDAVNAVVDAFEGQPVAAGQYEVSMDMGFGGALSELGRGNALALDGTAILENIQAVQTRNGMATSPSLVPLEWKASAAKDAETVSTDFPNLSIEMETGTGKTYVYLRTIYELHARYGFTKFVIVVPSVAIREGVMSNLQLTRDHFAALYDNTPCDSWVYDSRQYSRVRQFAGANTLQVMVINIDAFNKPANAVIHKEQDGMSGRKPIEFVQAARPVVIMDEPQNMESDTAKAAIASLNPLCTLRYSATHRNPYNTLYRLNPVQAYDLGLVKRIQVTSVLEEKNFNSAFIQVESVTAPRNKFKARLLLDVQTATGVVRKTVDAKATGDDLFLLSGGREVYEGFTVSEMDTASQFVEFTNGVRLYVGQRHGTEPDAIMRVQVEDTVKAHLEKEAQIQRTMPEGGRLKALSLFFLDRVADYTAPDAKVKAWFEAAYKEHAAKPAYAHLNLPSVDDAQGSYFACSKDGPKDTNGKTAADDDAYTLIMRDKERLMDRATPLRFIFSHSALREGWDNPNVFQICTLRESRSEVRKRQEIGRGLRLPVDEAGNRVRNDAINILTVVANESFATFAKALQEEIQEECGVSFEGRVQNTRDRRTAQLVPGWDEDPDFLALWEHIKQKTRYRVEYSTEELITKAGGAVGAMPAIETPKITVSTSEVGIGSEGVTGKLRRSRDAGDVTRTASIPDILSHLQRETELTRGTLARILTASGRLADAVKNPQQFLYHATRAVQRTLDDMMIQGIKYEPVPGEAWDMMLFESKEIAGYTAKMMDVRHSIYDAFVVDSQTERDFAATMDGRDDVKKLLKLPRWFTVDTPIGKYNPDWAIVKQEAGEAEKLFLIRETKSSTDPNDLRNSENAKIHCGDRHFAALPDVRFGKATVAAEV